MRAGELEMNIRKITLLAIFIALSVVGASIKIPAVVTSVALDAFPALLAAAFFGPLAGGIVGGLGHMLSAVIGGMMMGPLHLLVALEMFVLVFLFGIFYRQGQRYIAGIVFFIGNAFIAPIPFIFLFSVTFYTALLPSLIIGSLINTIVGLLLIPRLGTLFQNAYQKNAS